MMTFYNQKVVLIDIKNFGLTIFKINQNKIEKNYLKIGLRKFIDSIEVTGVEKYFDICLVGTKIKIIYLNTKGKLILKEDNNIIEIKSILNSIYELNIIQAKDQYHIFYLEKTEIENRLKLNHIIYRDNSFIEKVVDTLDVYNIINPLKVIQDNNNIILTYYFRNQICMKIYDINKESWSPSFTLTDNKDKFYLDMIKIGRNIHIVYAYYEHQQFSICYEEFYMEDDVVYKNKNAIISGKGNNTDPVILYYDERIWVVWKDNNKLMSTFSYDGHNWGDIYYWDTTKKLDMVKYKYLNNYQYENIVMDNIYGSINPEIKFIGFSRLEDASKLNE